MTRRRAGPRALVRVLVVLVITAGALMLMSALLARFDVDNVGVGVRGRGADRTDQRARVALLIRIALPFTVLTLGLGVLVLNGGIVLFVASLDPASRSTASGGRGRGDRPDRGQHRGHVAARDRRRRLLVPEHRQAPGAAPAAAGDMSVPGVFFLEIDGLPTTCCGARSGTATRPTSPRWLHDGSHHLSGWETDWSSQTGACQAGLLHGDNDDMPGVPLVGEGPRHARSSPTTRATPPRSSGGTRTGAGCCTRTAPAGRTSSPATRCTRC